MIRTIDIDINAANPNLPLAPFQAFVTSPSSVRIRNVPRKIGAWEITGVSLAVNYPDNTLRTAVCKLTAGVWVGTVVGSASVGSSVNGYAIIASGTDENGNGITGYILGKGDVLILSTDGTITIGETTYYVHLVDTQPTAPKKGDLCVVDGVWKVYTGSAWSALGSQTTVTWDSITGKPTSFTPSAHASSHAAGGADAITPAEIGAEVSGAAASAVSAHDSSTSAHATLFGAKQDAISDLETIRSGAALGATSLQDASAFDPAGSASSAVATHDAESSAHSSLFAGKEAAGTAASLISADVTHAKSISATGVSTACTPDANGNVDVSSLFSGANTSLTSTIGSTIAARCQSLDPVNSSISDVIKALKGIN